MKTNILDKNGDNEFKCANSMLVSMGKRFVIWGKPVYYKEAIKPDNLKKNRLVCYKTLFKA